MPRFEYKCSKCDEQVIIARKSGVTGVEECLGCGNLTLERVYSFNLDKKNTKENKAGVLVKSHIKEAEEELRKEKDKLAKKDFEI